MYEKLIENWRLRSNETVEQYPWKISDQMYKQNIQKVISSTHNGTINTYFVRDIVLTGDNFNHKRSTTILFCASFSSSIHKARLSYSCKFLLIVYLYIRIIRIFPLILIFIKLCTQSRTISVPSKVSCCAGLYMSYLDLISKNMPPILMVRGNQEPVLTYYS